MPVRISTRGRYGIRALLDIALHREEEPVMLKDIARRQQFSLRYLERLITPLIAGGLIRSTRGSKGGVSLVQDPADIKLSDVFLLMEGSIAPVECVTTPGICGRSGNCATRDIWHDIKHAIDGILESTTLQDLVIRQHAKETAESAMYYI